MSPIDLIDDNHLHLEIQLTKEQLLSPSSVYSLATLLSGVEPNYTKMGCGCASH
jgi:hypothetical protein